MAPRNRALFGPPVLVGDALKGLFKKMSPRIATASQSRASARAAWRSILPLPRSGTKSAGYLKPTWAPSTSTSARISARCGATPERSDEKTLAPLPGERTRLQSMHKDQALVSDTRRSAQVLSTEAQ